MNAAEIKQNIKLGSFVLAGLFLFLISVFFIGKESNFFNRTFVVSAVFKNVEGLQKGDNVWLSGVKIGTVQSVEIITLSKVIVNLSLRDKQNQFIRKNATASIGSDGFIGNKIVVIRPGNSSGVIQEHDTINAQSPADTQELLGIAKEVGENTRTLTEDLKLIVFKIKNGKGIIGELLNEGPLSKDLRATVSALKTTGENTARASSDLSSLIYDIGHGKGLIPTLITDTSFAGTFKVALINVRRVSQNASHIAKNLDSLATKINNTHNAVGVLLADTAFAHKLQKTMQNAESASHKLDQDMEALKHNFLLRGYFRKQEKKEKEEKAKVAADSAKKARHS
jgi:phospholipid/cholesterol/gamma-HCH transport system substrate-binding protein